MSTAAWCCGTIITMESRFAEYVRRTRLSYDLGSGDLPIGASAPDFEFEDGSRLGDHLRKRKELLLDSEAGALDRGDREEKVEYIESDKKERLGLSALLVRSDGVVA